MCKNCFLLDNFAGICSTTSIYYSKQEYQIGVKNLLVYKNITWSKIGQTTNLCWFQWWWKTLLIRSNSPQIPSTGGALRQGLECNRKCKIAIAPSSDVNLSYGLLHADHRWPAPRDSWTTAFGWWNESCSSDEKPPRWDFAAV